ncbi:hypothetical protein CspeluHIS016_0702190 [Cutaneotrichosporon spelunceum]|uniref:Uncharacterized protein n=1 Tax=Cutaneotrichosporon spelunceum TaxID=1672016 RepID=A0AAD3TYJ2_9TREE|nr:hypothetical protein CspeluHIS016_0702190 [Cutaneotrichosporon spelunceum]
MPDAPPSLLRRPALVAARTPYQPGALPPKPELVEWIDLPDKPVKRRHAGVSRPQPDSKRVRITDGFILVADSHPLGPTLEADFATACREVEDSEQGTIEHSHGHNDTESVRDEQKDTESVRDDERNDTKGFQNDEHNDTKSFQNDEHNDTESFQNDEHNDTESFQNDEHNDTESFRNDEHNHSDSRHHTARPPRLPFAKDNDTATESSIISFALSGKGCSSPFQAAAELDLDVVDRQLWRFIAHNPQRAIGGVIPPTALAAVYDEAMREVANDVDGVIETTEEIRKELDADRKALGEDRRQLDEGRKELDAGRKELGEDRRQLDEGRKELDAGRKKLDADRKKLDEDRKALDRAHKALDRERAARGLGRAVLFQLRRRPADSAVQRDGPPWGL